MGNKSLTYFKWFENDAKVMKDNLSMEQSGILFHAVMDYLRDGITVEVPPELAYPYADYRSRVDRSQAQYISKCETLAANGAKGGQAKAANAKRNRSAPENEDDDNPGKGLATFSAPTFTPPTKKQFRQILTDISSEDGLVSSDIDVTSYAVSEFYNELKAANWRIGGVPITGLDDLHVVFGARFPNYHCEQFGYALFCALFSNFNGFRNSNGESQADIFLYDFFSEEYFDSGVGAWRIDKEIYSWPKRINAISAILPILAAKHSVDVSSDQFQAFMESLDL